MFMVGRLPLVGDRMGSLTHLCSRRPSDAARRHLIVPGFVIASAPEDFSVA